MLDSRAFGARMTRLSLGLDSRLCGNDEGVVDSRLCGNGGMGSFGGCVLATGCEQGGAKNQAQEGYCRLPIADCRLPIADCRLPIADCRLPIADCRLPIADCRLPIADCRLPIADCRLPIADCRFYGNGVCGQVILVGLCHVFSFVLCQWLLPPTKAIIHKKTRMSSFFVKKFVIPAPAYAGAGCGGNQLAAGQRMLRRRKPPVTGRGFYIPVIPAQAGINSPQGSECCGGESRR